MSSKYKIVIVDSPTQLAQKGADIFTGTAKDHATKNGQFIAAISGGSTPRSMHRLLAEDPYYSEIPWSKTHIFWVDERCVLEDDPASNYGTAKKDFLDRIPIPKDQIYPMPGEVPPEDGALKYQEKLTAFFQLKDGEFPIFDLIFLGIGADGHTASLFPEQKALYEGERLVVAVKGGEPYLNRLTMTYPVLNQGRLIVFVVSGKEKTAILKTIFEDKQALLPAQNIKPINGKLIWLLDKEAASLLSGEMNHDKSQK